MISNYMICLHTYNYNQEAIIIAKIANCQRHGNYLDYHRMIFNDFQALRNHTSKTMKEGRRGTGQLRFATRQERTLISQGRESFFRWSDTNSRQYHHQGQKSGKTSQNLHCLLLCQQFTYTRANLDQQKNQRLQVRSHQLLSPLYLWFQQFQSLRKDWISRSCRDQISLNWRGSFRLWDTMATQEIHLVNPSKWFEEANVLEWPYHLRVMFNLFQRCDFESSFFPTTTLQHHASVIRVFESCPTRPLIYHDDTSHGDMNHSHWDNEFLLRASLCWLWLCRVDFEEVCSKRKAATVSAMRPDKWKGLLQCPLVGILWNKCVQTYNEISYIKEMRNKTKIYNVYNI